MDKADLTPAGFPGDVRDALEVNLAANRLPDATILRPIYAGAAVDQVVEAVTETALTSITADSDDGERLQRATVLLTAYRLVYAVAQITSITVTARDAAYTRRAWDPEAKKADLLAQAAAAMGDAGYTLVVEVEPAPAPAPFAFVTAGGKGRGA